MFKLTKANLREKIQHIIETYYLQPFNRSKKNNLRDGYIERKLHGGMHAARAVIWSSMMHQFLSQHASQHVTKSLKAIGKYTGMYADEIILHTLFTVSCHDAAREDDNGDHNEKPNADIAKKELIQLGVDDKTAAIFAAAIEFKDQPDEFRAAILKLGITDSDTQYFNYLRLLVNLGDNIDLLRCVGKFEFKYLAESLAAIPELSLDTIKNELFDILKQVQQCISAQHDMYFKNKILDENSVIISITPDHYSDAEKVKYEHADNVFDCLYDSASHFDKLKKYIPELTVNAPQPADIKPTFDPFLHGTNSSIFAVLPKTKYKLMSPLKMAEKYHAAPLCGELLGGGYDSVGRRDIKKGNYGNIAFGRLSSGVNSLSDESNHYTLNKILQNYSTPVSNDNSINRFREQCNDGTRKSFSNINLINIYLARARQNHPINMIITPDEIANLNAKLHIVTQFLYFIQLLGTHIFPDFALIESLGFNPKHVGAAVYATLDINHILRYIAKHKINCKEILENPSKENLETALGILALPYTKITITTGCFRAHKSVIELPVSQLFCLHESTLNYYVDKKGDSPDYFYYKMMQGRSESYSINSLLEGFVSTSYSTQFVKDTVQFAQKAVPALEQRIKTLRSLINAPQDDFEIPKNTKYFTHDPFPIILIVEDQSKVYIFNHTFNEFRSRHSLKLGRDITMIATDTDEHRAQVINYLKDHQIINVDVVLFTDLELAKKTHIRPQQKPVPAPVAIPTVTAPTTLNTSGRTPLKRVPSPRPTHHHSQHHFFTTYQIPHDQHRVDHHAIETLDLTHIPPKQDKMSNKIRIMLTMRKK
ncbi:MAG TPA: SidE phosphodiesterase domain-containing protein [Gammaproteobacteria bacterium]|nr:SidE phosphodiesterase domain-containing protein [Gammaproteobacteria bacterium]